MKEFFKTVGLLLLAVIAIATAITICYFAGYIVRLVVWLFCAIWEFLWGRNVITKWIYYHDNIVHIICSAFCFLVMVGVACEDRVVNTNTSTAKTRENYSENSRNNSKYDNNTRNMKKERFHFVDCSGHYRRWGEDFVDHKGKWCKWGTGFYDYDDNYIHWGKTFKDSSGHYRQWGEGFIDAAGNYIDVP